MAVAPVFDIAISGASFAGLALARALLQAFGSDISIAIVDRDYRDAATSDGDVRASAISASSKAMLSALDAWSQVEAAAQPVTTIEITDTTLNAALRPALLTYDNILDDGQPATYIVPNASLITALRSGLNAYPSLAWFEGRTTASISTNDAAILLTLADGAVIKARLAVAADGRNSMLRDASGIKCIDKDYGQTGIVTRVDAELPHHGIAVQHFLPGGPFAMLPLRGQSFCITWSEDAREAQRIQAFDAAGWDNEIARRARGRFGVLTRTGATQTWPLALRIARSMTAQRVAVIGDAAHSVHPIAGQGLNLALRDVAALAQSIASGMRLGFDPGNAGTLERFQRWRRFDVTQSVAAFDTLNQLFRNDNAIFRGVRGAGLSALDRVPAVKRFFVAEGAGVTGELPRLLHGQPL